jgi:glycosyltransferase involved in cell wall biosynthesis
MFKANKDKILILVPNETARGGITNYYSVLRKYFGENIIYVRRGAKNFPYHKSLIEESLRLIIDFQKVLYYLLVYNIGLVQTTTSFSSRSILRDAVYIMLAKLLRKKVIVFYRGWDSLYANQASQKILFKKVFMTTNASIVLSQYQMNKLLKWGYTGKIFIESTLVDDDDVFSSINPTSIISKVNARNETDDYENKLLYLGRLEKTKGIFELIEGFRKLSKIYPLKLTIAGDGTAEHELKKVVSDYGLTNVQFVGFIEGINKIQVYSDADIFILPSYSEGMPNAVIEAMAFGLPVLTTPVGGLVDFFQDGINGYFIQKKNSDSIVEGYNKIIRSRALFLEIALNNHRQAISKFMASDVAKRNEEIFKEILNLDDRQTLLKKRMTIKYNF